MFSAVQCDAWELIAEDVDPNELELFLEVNPFLIFFLYILLGPHIEDILERENVYLDQLNKQKKHKNNKSQYKINKIES